MTTPRKQVAAQIKLDNPGYDVWAWPFEPDELRRPAVMVLREEISQAGHLTHKLTVQVYTQAELPSEKAEDLADDVLDDVLMSLQRLDVLGNFTAKRVVLAEKFQGWTVDVEWESTDYYKTEIHKER